MAPASDAIGRRHDKGFQPLEPLSVRPKGVLIDQMEEKCRESTKGHRNYYSGFQTLEKSKRGWMGRGDGHGDGPTEGVVVVRDVDEGSRPGIPLFIPLQLQPLTFWESHQGAR